MLVKKIRYQGLKGEKYRGKRSSKGIVVMEKSKPHPVDVHVGRRLRSRRTILGMSQEELGVAVKVTFQQIQKYERGFNRIGSSRLYEFACVLNIDIGYFFEDYANNDMVIAGQYSGAASKEKSAFGYPGADGNEVNTLLSAFYAITDESVRGQLLNLIKTISGRQEARAHLSDTAKEQDKIVKFSSKMALSAVSA